MTTPATHLNDSQRAKVKREIDKADQTAREIACIVSDINDLLGLPINEILPSIQELFTPDVLLNSATWKDRQVFYILRVLLNQIGVEVSRTPGVAMPNKIFDAIFGAYPEINQQCHALIKSYQYPNLHQSLTYVPPSLQNPDSATSLPNDVTAATPELRKDQNASSNQRMSLAKQRQAVGSGFYNDSSKFTGSRLSGQPLHIVKRKFQELIFEQEIPEDQIVQLLHNCLSGVANDYFYTYIRDSTNNMDEAFEMLERRFSSKQHHSQALTYLKRLSFQGIKNEKNCTDLEALSTANERILQQVPQCGPSYQGEHQDGHKTQFLADIVDGEPWAQHVLTARITSTDSAQNGMDYDTFYSMLTSALTLMENRKSDDPSETLYGAQYGNPPHRTRKYNKFNPHYRRSGTNIREARSKNRCFICKQPGHWKNECPNRPVSMTEVIKARVKEAGGNNRAAAEILFSLAQEEDNYQEYMEAEEPEDSENTFETLLNNAHDNEQAEDDISNVFDELTNSNQKSSQGFQ